MYEIEKGILLTESQKGQMKRIYPFQEMEIDDSFFVPVLNSEERRKKQVSICGSAVRHRPKKFITRVVEGGVRCWRVE